MKENKKKRNELIEKQQRGTDYRNERLRKRGKQKRQSVGDGRMKNKEKKTNNYRRQESRKENNRIKIMKKKQQEESENGIKKRMKGKCNTKVQEI